jgi:multiple sugar transport system permease protein/sn-glycerol 3-phosphate transport system permease protein
MANLAGGASRAKVRRGKAAIRRDERLGYLAIHAFFVALCLAIAFPLLWMLSTAFKPPKEVFTADLRLLPAAPTLDNFGEAFRLRPVGAWFVNSAVVAAGVTVGKLIVSLPAAYAFARGRFAGRGTLFALIVGTMIVPDVVTIVPNYVLVARLDWLNTWQGAVVPSTAAYLGFHVFLLRQAMLAIPGDIFDAARLDGAGPWSSFVDVAVPLVRPAIAIAAVVAFLASWNLYLWPLLVLSDPAAQTLPVGMRSFAASQDALQHWGPLMATAALAMLPPLVLFVAAQKAIVNAFVTSGIR